MKGQPPKIESLLDAASVVDDIKRFVTLNPMKDHIYYFPNNVKGHSFTNDLTVFDLLRTNPDTNAVIAGSAALWYLQDIFDSCIKTTWKASDTDIFFLGSVQNNRLSIGVTDFVMSKEQTPEELLMNFDLGCCRVACDFKLNFWVSIQCLNAIFYHNFPMPLYLKDKNSFRNILETYRNDETNTHDIYHDGESFMYDRFSERIKKYSNRGFDVEWINTNYILP